MLGCLLIAFNLCYAQPAYAYAPQPVYYPQQYYAPAYYPPPPVYYPPPVAVRLNFGGYSHNHRRY